MEEFLRSIGIQHNLPSLLDKSLFLMTIARITSGNNNNNDADNNDDFMQ